MAEVKKKRHWSYLLLGIVLLILGLYVIANPLIAVTTLVIMFIISTFTAGITSIMEYSAHKSSKGILVIGILNLIFGFIFVFNFFVTVVFMPFLAGIWLLVWGVFEIGASIKMKPVFKNWWLYLITGILSIIIEMPMMLNFNLGTQLLSLFWYLHYNISHHSSC
ncbi:hypothetical protein AZF37_09650 [endosymbiont 'TC1' of Trimyema compressum]|uniref:HdeD family acid-resistance protein n=1 Tax=endosymbiont 'TC1' of Trimyema compressum TaxID=243899 RepID=UPI0007F12E79|nr:DUF308 domain-containing protein [endosymbiont 'TC1' of Trimyema compressum]AMP21380.1 hypothetical protein AZF37_09650 [endosymbiont 'TC1' of Trimyema compressum]